MGAGVGGWVRACIRVASAPSYPHSQSHTPAPLSLQVEPHLRRFVPRSVPPELPGGRTEPHGAVVAL